MPPHTAKNAVSRILARSHTALLISAMCAILAHCGPGSWRGGVIASFAWSSRGVRVVEVPPDGPAAEAGLTPDDRVIAIDGVSVAGLSRDEVQKRLSGEVGSYIVLTVERAGRTMDVKIERAPYQPAASRGA